MSYYIQENEPLHHALPRIASEQVAKARVALHDRDQPARGVHKARKHFKKIRALARLLRDNLGESQYQKQNTYYRDLGRELSPLRDATSLLESLDLLRSRFEHQLQPESFRQVEAALETEREQLRAREQAAGDPREQVIAELERADEYIAALEIAPDSWEQLLGSLHRTYKRGYKAYSKSFGDFTMEELHEWRKRAKYLWYHYRLLKPAWKPVMKGFAHETHRLSDLLGDHRDLSLLQLKIEELKDALSPETRQLIIGTATAHQQVLLEQAQMLGGKIYAESPDDFRDRMDAYLPV